MKKLKRALAFVLFLCVLISLLPPVRFVRAAEVVQRYELDLDGIDVGATYLIVNSSAAGSGNALQFYYSSSWNTELRSQTLTIKKEDGITFIDPGFSNEANCQFQFTSSSSGHVTHGNYKMDLSSEGFTTGTPSRTLTFTDLSNGQYRISYSTSSWFSTSTYYLRCRNDAWSRTTSSSSVYLYKLVEYTLGCDVTFDGNGYDSGTMPDNLSDITVGDSITLPAPTDLQKVDGEDTWLFAGWNTAPDGSGTEYAGGETITVTEDMILYVEWYQQIKHGVSMITYLDNVATDVSVMAGYDKQFYALLEGGDGTYIPLTRRDTGVYSAKVVENGTYVIYALTADGQYEPVHGHTVVIYGQDGTTECVHYTVSYNVNGGAWNEGEAPQGQVHHFGEAATAWDKTPTLAGNRFLNWKDQDGNFYAPGQRITNSIDKPIVLTAQWEKLIPVTVNITIDHNVTGGGNDQDLTSMHNVIFTLLREENGVNLPVAEQSLTEGFVYNEETNTTTYQVVFTDMPRGTYRVASTKTQYETSIALGGTEDAPVIDVTLKYAPDNFDLTFDVIVNAESETEQKLMPTAVNVKVSYWGYDDNNNLGWHIITQQAGSNAPVTVNLENGSGSGYYPVWRYWSGSDRPYAYRVEVTSFVLPDGTIVPANSDDKILYTIGGTKLYEAKVSVADASQADDENLPGAYFDGTLQQGKPTITLEINPYTVTFNAGEGTVNGQNTITLEGLLRYPALYEYVAVPNATDRNFICWMENGQQATDKAGQLLGGNVVYNAHYSQNISIAGNVAADASYELDGKTVYIHDIDRAEKILVVLQKKVGDVYNDIASTPVTLTYDKDAAGNYIAGTGSYAFTDLPNDGTEYRVQVLTLNYNSAYDNDQNKTYTAEEAVAPISATTITSQVDVHLDFAPAAYQQMFRVDASQIQKDLRPTGVLAQILYRDLGNVHNYQVISQHTADPYGVKLELSASSATAFGLYDVWNWHTNGTPYEYQLQIYKVFGNDVAGAYDAEGTIFNQDRPFTIDYGRPNNYLQQADQSASTLTATLIPKKYPVYLDLNLGDDTQTPVEGLDNFLVDNDHGKEQYAFIHTWSFAEDFSAYPYREGYVFRGWKGVDPNGKYNDGVYTEDGIHAQGGVVHVGNTLAKPVTLVAQWDKLEGTDYTIRHLELNTNKVLRGATMVSGATAGSTVVAATVAASLEGYVYAGATVNGVYMEKQENPAMTITNDPIQNLMVIYYLPDGSDGFTEQVESNLEINKTAVLENNGTYTITMDTWTKNNPITTKIWQDTPMDVVLVLDQSGSMYTSNALNDLKDSVNTFVTMIADHGREFKVDHRIAIVGYASNLDSGYTNPNYPTAGKDGYSSWVNTGVFDSNGDFHVYPVTGFNYTEYTGQITTDGTYYTYANGNYLLLTYHDIYRHLITEDEARQAVFGGTQVYGYVDSAFVELTRNSSGLWLYGDRQLYSRTEFFTFHYDVWTHRDGLAARQIHAYGVGADYAPVDGHQGIYTRSESRDANPQTNIYQDALVPASLGANGAGMANPGLLKASENIGANGRTYVSYGLEMANKVFEANPLDAQDGRIRIVVVFTDGKPGDSSNFDEVEANNALEQSYIATHTHNADVYTIGLYGDDVVAAESDQDFFMTGLSSNYPDAQCMDDVWLGVNYLPATYGYRLDNGGPYFIDISGNGDFQMLYTKSVYENRQYFTSWGYTDSFGQYASIYKGPVADGHPVISVNGVGGYTIYRRYGDGYEQTANTGYYTLAENAQELKKYFIGVVEEITTNITTRIELYEDTILRDIMGQGLILTPGTVVTAYKIPGTIDSLTGEIIWDETQKEQVASATIPAVIPENGKVYSSETVDMQYTLEDGTEVTKENVPYIQIYNLNSSNPTNPLLEDTYQPHTVDITGYDFTNWYINEDHPGYKMYVTITRIEATEDVQWSRSTTTNHERSGLWLPADKDGKRELLLAFDQPTTIFVERAYVLDYGKEFTLSGWYFDDEDGKDANPVHIDCNTQNGMNWFDPEAPTTSNVIGGKYGNTKYGNVQLKDGVVTYAPTTTNWGGFDQFYVFGTTWRKTVLAQDANKNGVPTDETQAHLWNKVTVIPANNIYYEDSFITTSDTDKNGIEGFTFTGAWSVVGQDSGNTEIPEHIETKPYGDVHGWTDSLGDDLTFTDGSAHLAFANGFDQKQGAQASFTFTGTGVEVYTRTNNKSGMVIAMLNRKSVDAEGKETTTFYKSIFMDNLAVSGDYYHIPTIAIKDLPYGTYTMTLIATVTNAATNTDRYEYYIDGVRIHNPLGHTTNYQQNIVKDAYGLETNAVFTEVRDVLLDYGDFNLNMPDDTEGKQGAVFIDWIREGQGSGNDAVGEGEPTYEIGTFLKYGPKNEVYLSAGQAIVLKVAEANTYYVGLKSLTGGQVTAYVSGIDESVPTPITLSHTTDLYYQVTPVNGYIVIQNGNTDGAILSITNLRTTNLTAPAPNGGLLGIKPKEAVETVQLFASYMQELKSRPEELPRPEEPVVEVPSAQEQAENTMRFADALFTTVRTWLKTN